jgi:hypothetical protein
MEEEDLYYQRCLKASTNDENFLSNWMESVYRGESQKPEVLRDPSVAAYAYSLKDCPFCGRISMTVLAVTSGSCPAFLGHFHDVVYLRSLEREAYFPVNVCVDLGNGTWTACGRTLNFLQLEYVTLNKTRGELLRDHLHKPVDATSSKCTCSTTQLVIGGCVCGGN